MSILIKLSSKRISSMRFYLFNSSMSKKKKITLRCFCSSGSHSARHEIFSFLHADTKPVSNDSLFFLIVSHVDTEYCCWIDCMCVSQLPAQSWCAFDGGLYCRLIFIVAGKRIRFYSPKYFVHDRWPAFLIFYSFWFYFE